MLPILINILLVIHVLVSLLIILIVLMQRPKTEGLGAAFGGGMTENLFGAQTTNVLQTITRWLGGMFFALTLALSILYVRQSGNRSAVQEKLSNAPVPAAPVPAAPAPSLPEAPGSSPESLPPAGEPASLDGNEPVKIQLPVAKPGGVPSDAVQAPLPVPDLPKQPLPPIPGAAEKPLAPPANTPPLEKEEDASVLKKSNPAAPAPDSQEKKDAPAGEKNSGDDADPKPPKPPE